MHNNYRNYTNFGHNQIYDPTSTENPLDSYALNYNYFSQYRTDIGICLGLQSVNLNKTLNRTENFSFRPREPYWANTYNYHIDSNHLLFKHTEFQNYAFNRNSSRYNEYSDRDNSVTYYRQDAAHSANIRNYTVGDIYEREHQVATESATFNSKWINYNQAAPPKKKWIRDYMMSSVLFIIYI